MTRKPLLLFLLWVTFTPFISAQTPGQLYQELTPLPEPVTNNAVTAATVDGTPHVYSFMGLDSTKIWSGIHLKAWRLNTLTGEWQALSPVPDPSGGLIAGAASTVKNKIYVIGGYHVAQNGAETSSNKVHRFDPETNAWLSDGANIPKAIDDHVQAVWKDSLIFVVTGWSNTSNVTNVQIYNPATDSWATGTAVPNTTEYKAFGASGVIKGDTLYYCGGARDGSNFPATTVFRKGRINPGNPTQITWSAENNIMAKGYRMAAATMAGGLAWVGGSDVTYNYNGIAYNGSGGVPALPRVKTYYNDVLSNEINPGTMPPIMDLRGAAQIGPDYFITAGGIEGSQKVSSKVYGYFWAFAVNSKEPLKALGFQFSPNPATDFLLVESPQAARFQLMDNQGKLVRELSGSGKMKLETGGLVAGVYYLQVWDGERLLGVQKIVVARW